MLLSLPDEVILIITQLLNLLDARQLRRGCRRLFTIVALTRPKPSILDLPDETNEDVIDASLRALAQENGTRGILINMSHTTWQTRWIRWRQNPSALHPESLEFLSLRVPRIDQSWVPPSAPNPFMTTFHSLTHLECVGLWCDHFSFDCLPALVEVSFYHYFNKSSPYSCHNSIASSRVVTKLGTHKLVSFTMSAGALPPGYVGRLVKLWPTLRSLNLWPADRGHLSQVSTIDSTQAFEELFPHVADQSSLESLHASIENLSLNFVPVRPKKGPGSRLPTGAKRLGTHRYHYTVYDTDIVSASVSLSNKWPSLKVVGWMVPIVGTTHCKKVWCRREDEGGKTEWKCVTDENCWHETDTDVVFPRQHLC